MPNVFKNPDFLIDHQCLIRSNRSQLFYKKLVVKNFCKIHGKAPLLEPLFNNVTDPQLAI